MTMSGPQGQPKTATLKSLLGNVLFGTGVGPLFFRNSALVIALHRVRETTTPDDGLTTSVEMFDRYCRFFTRHFRVVPLSELVERLTRGLPLNRHLAITFDDGYLDNFDCAVPVLERYSLPATFFVVSDWVESNVVPWWDRERGVTYPWMNWDHVRSLSRRGFEIGAHTRTHVDLGRVSVDEARREVFGARDILEERLGHAVNAFAYPYGGRRHITDANREIVRAAGFTSCSSCYGGMNSAGADPFNLRREPISPWHASPQQFGFDVSLGRSVIAA
jgi:peptidoglycan/xylan/chitin deacetylase (PgdA/CDA1 family)